MDNKFTGIFLVVAIGAIVYFTGAWQSVWKFFVPPHVYVASGHPQWSPIMWQQDDKIVGVGPDLVSKIFSDLKINISIPAVGRWDEVQAKARDGEVDVLVAAYKTDEREIYMDYSLAYTTDPIAVFAKRGVGFKFDKWENLIGKRGIAMIGDSYGQKFDDFIKAKLNVARVASAEDAFNLLISGKVDYFVHSLYAGEKLLAGKNMNAKIQIMPKPVAEENFYITISKKSPLVKYLPEINKLIGRYQADGTIANLLAKYRNEYVGL